MIYAVAIWVVAFVVRPRWLAIIALVVGLLPLFLMTAGVSITISGHEFGIGGWMKSLGMFGAMLHIISGIFSGVLLLGGVLIALQRPRPGAHQCEYCFYDLSANEAAVCPECGGADPVRRGLEL